ncbi:ATP-binding protein [Herbidospora mongoliensis]|uniref:ATP-binding protein n=1 Tax=Herbidospora mongoliensis TaxID=688067 RepID=UPI000836A50F|nr:ATP-binding protein [Herbidospora mongoliensis]
MPQERRTEAGTGERRRYEAEGSVEGIRRPYEKLSAHPISVRVARALVRDLLHQWQRPDLVESVELITAELISNALKATADALAAESRNAGESGEPPTVVGLGLYQIRTGIVVEVWDRSRMPPKAVNPTEEEEGGRGLLLVGALSRAWGYRRPLPGGKVVYATVEAGAGADTLRLVTVPKSEQTAATITAYEGSPPAIGTARPCAERAISS